MLSAFILLCKCDKSKMPGDSFMFGIWYGECNTNCTTFYLLKNGKLFKDRNENPERRRFNTNHLSNEKFEIAKQLQNSLPDFLETNTGTIGRPDAADQGTIFIRSKKNGKV